VSDGLTVHTHAPGSRPAHPPQPAGAEGPAAAERAAFYYDFAVPECYLMAERVLGDLPVVPEWTPVRQAGLGAGGPVPGRTAADPAAFAARVAAQGLQPLRWPAAWPWDPEPALLAATYAKSIGRAVAFSLAAFRQAYAGGRDLSDLDSVVIAAAANEMHPRAVLKGIELRSVRTALDAATARAAGHGVGELPALRVGDDVFTGRGAIEAAGAALQAETSR
jgi:2-hydroxychromene-2-carboxylate isomerase